MSCCKEQKPARNNKVQKLGGWSFEPELYEFLVENLPFESTVLELGSGYGTDVLSQHYKMFSIEHNEKFVGVFNSTYIHAPMRGYWYDRSRIEGKLPEKYDAILVDGPVGHESRSRIGFWENIDLFNTEVLLLIDDTNRAGERDLFERIFAYCNFDFAAEKELPESSWRRFKHFKTFSVIYPR